MIEFYKLIFDVSLYYLLSGYFTRLLFNKSPSVFGFALLVLTVLFDTLLRSKNETGKKANYFILILPIIILLEKPTICAIIQMIPAWMFVCYSIISDRITCNYDEFRSEFSFGLKLLLLLIFGFLFQDNLSLALTQTIPYLILMLALGVCLLRLLRERKPDSLRQGLYMIVFMIFCVGLTVGNVPQLLLKGFGYVYRSVLAPLLFGLAILFAAVFYISYLILKWLVSRAQGNKEDLNIQLESAAETLGIDEQIQAYDLNFQWLKILLLILFICAVALFVFLIFRRFLGQKNEKKDAVPYSDKKEKLISSTGKAKNVGIIRPREPRLLVRYYYARFLLESLKRDIRIPRGKTVDELSLLLSRHFDKESVNNLSEVYTVARYSNLEPISSETVNIAAESWKVIKHTKKPKVDRK